MKKVISCGGKVVEGVGKVVEGVGKVVERVGKYLQEDVQDLLGTPEYELDSPSVSRRPTTRYNSTQRVLTKNQSRVLVLVVNAKHKDLLDSIDKNERVLPENCQPLYRATQGLWLADKSQLKNKPEIDKYFSSPNADQYAVPEKDQSEYDVYFVAIDLKTDEPGFKENVTSIERLDAFEKLPQIATGVQVSPRLHCSAYELPFLYAR
jgi:hypothetical protein